MIEIKYGNFGAWIASLLMVGMLSGCTHVNPATGQSEIDYGATAGVAGAALGAAALGVALSNNDDDRYYGGPGYYGGGGYYGGSRGHNTYNKTNNVYVNNNKELNNRRAVNRPAGTNRNRTQVKKGGMNRGAANVNRAARPAKGQRARHR
jgi:hypothetical protein